MGQSPISTKMGQNGTERAGGTLEVWRRWQGVWMSCNFGIRISTVERHTAEGPGLGHIRQGFEHHLRLCVPGRERREAQCGAEDQPVGYRSLTNDAKTCSTSHVASVLLQVSRGVWNWRLSRHRKGLSCFSGAPSVSSGRWWPPGPLCSLVLERALVLAWIWMDFRFFQGTSWCLGWFLTAEKSGWEAGSLTPAGTPLTVVQHMLVPQQLLKRKLYHSRVWAPKSCQNPAELSQAAWLMPTGDTVDSHELPELQPCVRCTSTRTNLWLVTDGNLTYIFLLMRV